MLRRILLVAACAVTLSSVSAEAANRDGHLFDQGVAMDGPSERASEATGRVAALVGQWDVTLTTYTGDTAHETTGLVGITWMNRGHGLLERFQCEDFDGEGHERATVVFLVHTPSTDTWQLSLADSWTENITLLTGAVEGEDLVFRTSIRRGGSSRMTHTRVTLAGVGVDGFSLRWEQATDDGGFSAVWSRRYARRAPVDDFLSSSARYGEPAPGLPAEARQFDFLRGEWDSQHWMVFPNGQEARWPAFATAIFALNGHSVLEHNWFDVDPNVPDMATTILRVYNRAMRRWESMFTTNRANTILHFGGVQEGDQIVLHPFETDTSSSPISQWTFHRIHADSYGWFANTSTDRGETFQKTWTIDFTRRAGP